MEAKWEAVRGSPNPPKEIPVLPSGEPELSPLLTLTRSPSRSSVSADMVLFLYINAYTCNLKKWCRWTYLQNRNRDTDIENKCADTKRGKGIGRLGLTYTHCCVWNRWLVRAYCIELYSVLCADLYGRKFQKGGGMCIHMADSLQCTAETSAMLWSNCTLINVLKGR